MENVPLHDAARGLWVVPIRHHSPACAAQLERLIAAVKPAGILVEGPCDFDPLIEQLCDPRTRAPVAIVSLRELAGGQATRRAASYFPFCEHSPELVALQAAAVRGVPARFIDLPSTSREMMFDEAGKPARSLLGDERSFDVGDYVAALARELGCRDGNEVWDTLFEARIADDRWQGFFTDVGRYCACIRAATEPARLEQDGTLAREAQMRAILAEVRGSVSGPIIAVVGGFHAAAVFEPTVSKAAGAKVGAGRPYLMRYGMRQLDALSGYGAGLPLPGFYDRLWRTRADGGKDLALTLITGFAEHLRSIGGIEAPSFPVIANAVEQAQRLAALRGRPFPARDDIVDAIRSSFIKDEIPVEQIPLLNELRSWLIGTAIGDVPPSAGSPPLVEAVRTQALSLGFTVADGERRNRELDIYRKPRHREASRFCHAMALIDAQFGQRTAGPDFRNDVSLDRLLEVWSICWSPLVEVRLIELSEAADTLAEALAFLVAQKLAALSEQGKGRSALAAIDLFSAACRAGVGSAASSILALVETQIIEDPQLVSVVAALTDLVLLRRGRDILGIAEVGPIDHLIGAAWRRVLLLLPGLAECGEEQIRESVSALADLRGLIELARSSEAPMEINLFDEALARLRGEPLTPMLAGAVTAFALIDGQGDAVVLGERLRGELASGYVDPGRRLAFLSGVIAIARELLWTVPEIIAALHDVVARADETAFYTLVPHLRLALMPLDPREVDRLAEEVATRVGGRPDQLATHIEISESELANNLRLDRQLADVMARDGVT
ncbi:MAG: hypothetical protein HY834_11145 [Devosia nanyangense]|uniref:Uncharacterized protein n=1 Tax=Devosia nanyangense TaxID=1228055 RepID=A0A933NYR5_9HYPH|nr:hypothetical protein [Devosia nanyangense]